MNRKTNNLKKNFDIEYKVIILGESRIGKTSILNRLNNQEFTENTITTVGLDFVNIYYLIENLVIKLQIWDTAGQERFRTITKSHYRNTKGIILAFDICNKDSFEKLEYWVDSFMNMQLNSEVIYLLGNKVDLADYRKVSYEQGKKFADKNLMKYFETSAKTDHQNLFEIFKSLAYDIYDSNHMHKMRRYSSTSKDNFVYIYNMSHEIQVKTNTINKTNASSNKTILPFKRKLKNKRPTTLRNLNAADADFFDNYSINDKKKTKIKHNCCKIS